MIYSDDCQSNILPTKWSSKCSCWNLRSPLLIKFTVIYKFILKYTTWNQRRLFFRNSIPSAKICQRSIYFIRIISKCALLRNYYIESLTDGFLNRSFFLKLVARTITVIFQKWEASFFSQLQRLPFPNLVNSSLFLAWMIASGTTQNVKGKLLDKNVF